MSEYYSNFAGIILGTVLRFFDPHLGIAIRFAGDRVGSAVGRIERGKRRAVVGHMSEAVFEEKRPAPLQLIAFLMQLFDALVDRHDAAHLFANALRIVEGK